MVDRKKPRPRKFIGSDLVIASHNLGKVAEVESLMSSLVANIYSAGELGLIEPDETGLTFVANAQLKAVNAAKKTGLPALGDDSGLVVAALNGAPGIYSARWAEGSKDFDVAMKKIERELGGTADRRAHFTCALSLVWPDGHSETVEGNVRGELVWPPRGEKGFGYDPMFLGEGYNVTFGEMSPEEKHKISHRGKALKKLVSRCFSL